MAELTAEQIAVSCASVRVRIAKTLAISVGVLPLIEWDCTHVTGRANIVSERLASHVIWRVICQCKATERHGKTKYDPHR